MSLPEFPPVPTWIESGAKHISGLDLLGLRLPVQTIGVSLLNGITTVTPSIRYLSFRSWIASSYAQARLPDHWKMFREYAAGVEAAIAYGNLLNDPGRSGILGVTEGRKVIAASNNKFPLKPLVMQLGVNIYGGPSEQLRLSFSSDASIPGLTKERGVVLAELLGESVAACQLGREFASGQSPEWASRSQLEEFGQLVDIENIPEEECEVLIRTLLPQDPLPGERPRLATYATLLFMAGALSNLPQEDDLFEAAMSRHSGFPDVLNDTLDGWLMYLVRDLLAVSHEVVMQEIIAALGEKQQELGGAVRDEDILHGLISQVDDHREALKDLRLLKGAESPFDLSFRQLQQRVQKATAKEANNRKGLCRWEGSLDEMRLIKLAFSAGVGALSVLPVAWLLSLERAEFREEKGETPFDVLSYQGWARIGLRDVIVPNVQRFIKEDWSFVDVIAELARRTVDQHLRISWARLSQDPSRDVAVMTSDGERWSHRADFYSGRTASRIYQAVSWLRQLRLVDDDGLTKTGRSILKTALHTLEAGGTA